MPNIYFPSHGVPLERGAVYDPYGNQHSVFYDNRNTFLSEIHRVTVPCRQKLNLTDPFVWPAVSFLFLSFFLYFSSDTSYWPVLFFWITSPPLFAVLSMICLGLFLRFRWFLFSYFATPMTSSVFCSFSLMVAIVIFVSNLISDRTTKFAG